MLRFDQCLEMLLTAGELESIKVLMNVVYILNAFIKGATDNCNTVVLGTTQSCSDAVPSPSIVACFWVSELTAPVNSVHSEVLVSYMGFLFSFLLRLHMA